jgi:ABC-type bacteriocin/lantibiotic exporter with double-glycine peptidase domain
VDASGWRARRPSAARAIGLYDIDRIVSRTLAYAIVTSLLVGVYLGLVLLASLVLPSSSPVAVAGSTLVAAALFHPLRRRVQRAVDRRFNRARYNADLILDAFAARMQDAVDLGTVRDELANAVHTAFEPARMYIWIREP